MDTNAWAILARLLELASDEFNNHGCNDFDLPNTPENIEFLETLLRWSNPEGLDSSDVDDHISRDGKTILIEDWLLMDYFAHLAKELAGIEE